MRETYNVIQIDVSKQEVQHSTCSPLLRTEFNSARAMNNKQLFAAASDGDLELVKDLLNRGANKEYIDVKVSEVIYYYLSIDINQR